MKSHDWQPAMMQDVFECTRCKIKGYRTKRAQYGKKVGQIVPYRCHHKNCENGAIKRQANRGRENKIHSRRHWWCDNHTQD